ncbi:glycosyltransferase family 4 protein [Chitinophaga defluvii]|uniref:Glycosyltransferase family 4 protein n=1 Tax=Chitinophaga defluvii TaxID=3163343 RepID=A0ABV2T0N9_9BACT
MNKQKKFWVVTELFFPEETSTAYIMTKVSRYIAESKPVHVICGPISYKKEVLSSTGSLETQKIKVTRVKTIGLDKDKLLQRILRLILLSIQLSFKLLVKARKGDDVMIVTNPAPLVVLVVLVCKIKGLKCFTIVHDVFPENLVVAKLIKPDSSVYKLLKYIFNNAYRRMSVLFVLGRDMKAIFEEKLSKYKVKPAIHVVESWADIDDIKPAEKIENSILKELGIIEKVIFQFAGNLGRVQGLMELCTIIKDIENPEIHFMMVGNGALKKDIEQFIKTHDLKNLTLLDSFSRTQQQNFLNATDVGIVSLQEGMKGLGVPSKSYNIMAAGKPILFIGDKQSEIARMVSENNIGWCFENDRPKELLNFFNRLTSEDIRKMKAKGEMARALAETRYSQQNILDKYGKIVSSEG